MTGSVTTAEHRIDCEGEFAWYADTGRQRSGPGALVFTPTSGGICLRRGCQNGCLFAGGSPHACGVQLYENLAVARHDLPVITMTGLFRVLPVVAHLWWKALEIAPSRRAHAAKWLQALTP